MTGSLASSYWGVYRTTHDADIVVELPSWHVRDFCARFPAPDWYVDPQAALEAVSAGGMFNIIHNPTGLKADIISFTDTPFNESRLSRARKVTLPDSTEVMFSSAEDVILKKLDWSREGMRDKHFNDILGIYKVSGSELDLAYLDDWALRIGVGAQWRTMRQRLGLPPPR